MPRDGAIIFSDLIGKLDEPLQRQALSKNDCPRVSFRGREMVPEGGLGRRLDDMHAFHHQRGISDQHIPRRRDDQHDYTRWCFKDLATAEAFAQQFSGMLLLSK